jgi:hypothetical protein
VTTLGLKERLKEYPKLATFFRDFKPTYDDLRVEKLEQIEQAETA